MYQYQNLEGISLDDMSQCLNSAFSDYSLPICLGAKELSELFAASGVDRAVSFGAFLDGALVGFVFNSCGLYQGHRAAFDVATGIVPAHRGKRIVSNLFALTQQALKQHQIKQYYLEVLQKNERAIALYKRRGFSATREFVVLSGSGQAGCRAPERVRYSSFEAFDFQQTAGLHRNNPFYEHSDYILKLHPERCEVAYLQEQRLSAWCVFARTTGQILQLGWDSIPALGEVVQALLHRYSRITVKNIDSKQQQVLALLDSLSFKVVAKQYEMVRTFD